MDLCVGLFIFLIVLGFVALVGHGLWLLGAVLFSGMKNGRPRGFADSDTDCPACGTPLRGGMRCRICRLDQQSRLARLLRDSEAADALLSHLHREDRLDAATATKVRRAIDERKTSAMGPTLGPPWLIVEGLLHEREHVSDLEPSQVRGVLFFFDQMNVGDWKRLRSSDLHRVGRLLDERGARWRALDVYEHLVTTESISSARLPSALQGARIALELSDRVRGKMFLELARQLATNPADRSRVEALERQLGGPTTVSTPEVVDIAEAVVEPEAIPTFAVVEEVPPPSSAVRRIGWDQPARREPEPPRPPRRSFGEMLAGFMEEKNILWGELAGGLLIVGCSIALVISLWQTLEKIPYFPFLILTAITAAIFAAGQYTLKHWKLDSTSRSLLLIATLLTPLDFLVLAGLQKGEGGLLSMGMEVFAVAGLGWLTWKAGRVLTHPILEAKAGRPDILGAITTAVASAGILLTPRWLPIAEPLTWLFVLISLMPVAIHAIGAAWTTQSLGGQAAVTRPQAASLLVFMGQTTFAVAMGLGFLVYWGGDPVHVFSRLALPIAVLAWPLPLAAAMLRRRIEGGGESGLIRVLATAAGIVGVALLALSLGLAWPRPAAIVAVGVANAAALAFIAWRWRQAWLLGFAMPSFGLAFVVGCLGIFGHATWEAEIGEQLAQMLVDARSSLAWIALLPLGLVASEIALRLGRALGSRFLWVGALLAAAAGMASIALEAMSLPLLAATVFGIAAVGGVFVAVRHRAIAIGWLGLATLFGSFFFATRLVAPSLNLAETFLASLTAYTWLIGTPGLVLTKRSQTTLPGYALLGPMRTLGLAASLTAILPWGASLHWDTLWIGSAAMLLLSVWWGLWSRREEEPIAFALCQAGTGLAAAIAALAWMHGAGEIARFEDLWTARPLQGLLLALSVWAMGWSIVRALLAKNPSWQKLLDPDLPALDRVALGIIVFLQFFVVVVGVLPDLGREIGSIVPNPAAVGLDLGRGLAIVGILAAACTWRMLKGRPFTGYLAIHFLAWTLPWLLAVPFRAELASASALRWWLGLLFPIALSMTLVRHSTLARLSGWDRGEGAVQTAGRFARGLDLVLGLSVAIVLTLATAERAFEGLPLGGPIPGTLFDRMGVMASMVGPLAFLALGLLGTGMFEAKPGYLFSAILLTTATMVGGTALGMVRAQIRIDVPQLLQLAQVGMVTAAGCTILWFALGKWLHLGYLAASIGLGRIISLPLLLVIAFGAFVRIDAATTRMLGGALGWIALGVTTLATIGVQRLAGRRSIVSIVGFDGVTAVLLATAVLRSSDVVAMEPFLFLLTGFSLFGLLLMSVSWLAHSGGEPEILLDKMAKLFPRMETQTWSFALAIASLAICVGLEATLRHLEVVLFCMGLVSLQFGVLAIWRRSNSLVYLSGLIPALLAAMEWINAPRRKLPPVDPMQAGEHEHYAWLFAAALAAASFVWGGIYLLWDRADRDLNRSRSLRFPFFAAAAAVATLVAANVISLVACVSGTGWPIMAVPALAMWGVTTAAALFAWIQCRDQEEETGEAMLYALGMVWTAGLVRWIGFDAVSVLRALPVALAAYAAAAAACVGIATKLGVTERLFPGRAKPTHSATWFLAIQLVVAAAGLLLGLRLVLAEPDQVARWLGPLAGMLAALAIGASAEYARQRGDASRGRAMAITSLLMLWVAAGMAGWATLDAEIAAPWLHRQVALLAVSLSAIVAFSHYGLGRVRSVFWSAAALRVAPVMAWISAALLLAILGQEFAFYDRVARRTPMVWPAVLLVFVLLVGLVAGLLWTALRTEKERWSERARKGMVWAAEVSFVVTLLHLRLNVPDIFPGYLGQQWPLVLMFVGFVSTALGEMFARRGNRVLADPLRKTGLALPMVPIFAFVLKPAILSLRLEEILPGIEPLQRYLHLLPESPTLHASLWFLLGTLYLMVAAMRRSGNHLLLAALWANFGMWVILANQRGLELFVHPQLWLIPLAVILLAAEMMNRGRLSPGQRQSVRWFALVLIYVSSSADLFIAGLGEWPMAVLLAVLSVAGIILGILLRVRAILFLGTAFLALDVFAQIWHAAVDHRQSWIWWICGIVLGVAILALFAVFEKRRNDIERVLEDLRQWE